MAGAKPSDRSRASLNTEMAEPDLTPIMNLVFMLILALLTMAAFLPLGLITVQAPKLGGGGGGAASADPDKPKLNLTVFVMENGYNIATSGKTQRGVDEGRAEGEALIPVVPGEGGRPAYNYAELNRRLIEIKKTFPKEDSVIISAEDDVRYEDIVGTMDAARGTEDGKELFPAVAFSAGFVKGGG